MPTVLLPHRPAHFADHIIDGRKLRVAHWHAAEAGACPLLFFSGIGANIELLAPLLERVRGRDVITFDMPGIGASADREWPYRLSAMADVASEIIAEIGVDQADIMGVSWGGMLAQEFAYRHPKRTRRLILAATSSGAIAIPGNPSTLAKMVNSDRYAHSAAIETYLQDLYGGSGAHLGGYATRMQPPSARGYLYQILAIAGWTSARKLASITAPTLILMGDDDKLVPPANGRMLKFLLPDATLEVLPDAGHLFVLTHMDAVLSSIEAFLDQPDVREEPMPRDCRVKRA